MSEDESEVARVKPQLTFDSITFSDGQTLRFEPDEIVVLVGPNNAGKSAALRELQAWVIKSLPLDIIKDASFSKRGAKEDLRDYLEKNAQRVQQSAHEISYAGIGYRIHENHIEWFDNSRDRHPVASFFTCRLATEDRIVGANPAGSIALYSAAPTHPIHLLLMDDALAASISGLFRQAFGVDLTVFRAGGAEFPLYVGEKPALVKGEDELSRSFVEKLQGSMVPLASQGDGMRSFATVLLHALASDSHSIQFLDEPEAFLHPPQARLLGEFIARERKGKSQLFIATHSTDILDGLLATESSKVRIVRMSRSGSVNHIKELPREKTKEISTDTLMRYSGVFRGIFYKRVFLTESDSDCLFYSSILNLTSISGNQAPDALFVHASGKHRMAKMAEVLRSLDVPVSVVADVDLLREEADVRALYEALGGDWTVIRGHVAALKSAVEGLRPPLNAAQVKAMIEGELGSVGGTGDFPKTTERAIKKVFAGVSPWSAVKQAGRAAIPGAQAIQHFDQLLTKCASKNLWIVPVGELEGFCRSVEGSHGPGFVQRVLESRDLETDPELQAARDFVKSMWTLAA